MPGDPLQRGPWKVLATFESNVVGLAVCGEFIGVELENGRCVWLDLQRREYDLPLAGRAPSKS